jgi:DNA-binding MarR family transcriptional regulator
MNPSRTERSARQAAKGATHEAAVRGPDELSARVLRQFRQIFNAVRAHFQSVEKAAGIGGAQLWALSIIRDRPGLGVNELAQGMDVHQSTASNLVKALAESGLVAVLRGGTDRRTVQLEVLTAGRAILRKAPGPYTGVLPRALRALDASALRRLEKDLSALIAALGADERAAGIPLAQLLGKSAATRRPRKG